MKLFAPEIDNIIESNQVFQEIQDHEIRAKWLAIYQAFLIRSFLPHRDPHSGSGIFLEGVSYPSRIQEVWQIPYPNPQFRHTLSPNTEVHGKMPAHN